MAGRDVTRAGPVAAPVPGRDPVVVVVSRWTLVAQAVAAGLGGRFGEASAVGLDEFVRTATGGNGKNNPPHPRDIVIMLLQEPADRAAVLDAQRLVGAIAARWVILTGDDSRETWGAFVEAGASWVGRASTPLDDLALVLADLAQGGGLDTETARMLVAEWQALLGEEERLLALMRRLTPREQTVLRLLYDGDNVRTIAESLEITEATVRSQVKSLLRRLDVNSQIAAIAAYQRLRDAEATLPAQLTSA